MCRDRRVDSWPFAKYKTAFTWRTTAKKKNAACSTRPTRGLFLGEGEYKIPPIWTLCLQLVDLFYLQLQQLNPKNECTRFLMFKFWLCTNSHTGQPTNRWSCPLFGLYSESCMSPLFKHTHTEKIMPPCGLDHFIEALMWCSHCLHCYIFQILSHDVHQFHHCNYNQQGATEAQQSQPWHNV